MLRGAMPVGTKLKSSLQGGLAGVTLPQEELSIIRLLSKCYKLKKKKKDSFMFKTLKLS